MIDREKVIKGLEWCMNEKHDCYREKGCPYENEGEDIGCKYALHRDALALLKALDVTPEELERLKKCRHECKIDCLLEHYERIKDERDALLKEQEHLAPVQDGCGALICGNQTLGCGVVGMYDVETGKVTEKISNYCAFCGRKVKWND